ncbi:MAG: amino acid ABC transporter ATP-binding protein [Propionibacteriaceae bacterium]|nr:amino acid ABC transporter ATP-binding protein [Propionibacteriaceae bacterium]
MLSITGLRKSYGELLVLDGIDVEVHRGEVVVVVGPSGCGKSTLLRCLNGLEPIQGGKIQLGDQVLSDPGTDWTKARQRIGMVFQDYELFGHLNVLDNIVLAPLHVQKRSRAEAVDEAMALLERVGLPEKAAAFPKELSGGQKQRIAIIRSLILHPELMLFDEVTAALDPEMVREVLDVIGELADEGMTMVLVTHELSFARAVADQIILLDAGHVAEASDPETFFTHPESERARTFLASLEFAPRHRVGGGTDSHV